MIIVIMPPPLGKRATSVAFVRLSVRPSIAYIANNLRTQRRSVPIFGMKVPHLRCDSHTSFKIKRSKVRVGGRRGIPCRPILAATLLVIIIGRNICNAVKVNWSYWKSLGCSIRGCTERKANFYMAFESTSSGWT